MNLLFRLFCVLATSWRRSRLGFLDECRTPFRVVPTDLDLFRHMNNGKYFSLQDLARVDLMLRTGVTKAISKHGWYPVVAAETLRFKKSLRLFEHFEIVSKVVYWDSKCFYLEHRFVRGSETVALGLIRARFLKRAGGGVDPTEGLAAIGVKTPSPPLPSYLAHWIASESEHAHSVRSL